MKMGDRQGQLVFNATGSKLHDYAELPPVVRDAARRRSAPQRDDVDGVQDPGRQGAGGEAGAVAAAYFGGANRASSIGASTLVEVQSTSFALTPL